jgi:hypothetical protein
VQHTVADTQVASLLPAGRCSRVFDATAATCSSASLRLPLASNHSATARKLRTSSSRSLHQHTVVHAGSQKRCMDPVRLNCHHFKV